MPPNPKSPRSYRNAVFSVVCPFGNTIILTERTWLGHTTPRHSDQDLVGKVEHVQATVQDPDHARRSTDKHHGQDTCVYERVVTGTDSVMRVPVIFDSPAYEQGGQTGRVMTVYILEPGAGGGQVGEIFWTADRLKGKEK